MLHYAQIERYVQVPEGVSPASSGPKLYAVARQFDPNGNRWSTTYQTALTSAYVLFPVDTITELVGIIRLDKHINYGSRITALNAKFYCFIYHQHHMTAAARTEDELNRVNTEHV